MKLSRGENAAVTASTVAVTLRWGSHYQVDPQALLLAENGKIRTNDDFVFYNAARHPSGAVSLTESGTGRAVLTVSLASVESAVSRIVVSASVDEGSFRDVRDLMLTVQDGSDALIAFEVDQPDAVTAMVLGEFYRRNGTWKFRSVGQGWTSGLRGLAEEFGVEVDDPPANPQPVGSPVPAPNGAAPEQSPVRMEPGWYPEVAGSGHLRWWNGTGWTADTRQQFPSDPALCDRCGRERRIPRFGSPPPCRWCESDVNRFMQTWRSQAWRVLTESGSRGSEWEELWVALRFERIHEASGQPTGVVFCHRVSCHSVNRVRSVTIM
ncbi:TerD family protein [Nocardia salmonicida]|uniref:TerD family protein n=1 Tax=Nocardia salmonicida TaxID=53431 RepID=UPI00340C5B68